MLLSTLSCLNTALMFSPLCVRVELKSLLGRKLIPSKFLNNQLKKPLKCSFTWFTTRCQMHMHARPWAWYWSRALKKELSTQGFSFSSGIQCWFQPSLAESRDHKYTMFLCGLWKIKSRFGPRQVLWYQVRSCVLGMGSWALWGPSCVGQEFTLPASPDGLHSQILH